MLVVTRRRNEAIVIADGIEIRVLRCGTDGVRLGITAPPEVPVHRQEIYEIIRAANASAADATSAVPPAIERLRRQIGQP